jgi:4-amino-4-deoxy-L-arabinose transferase-like glycosyltransferase
MEVRLDSRLAPILILGLIAVFAVWLILYATPEGLSLSDDSIAYIAGARSLLNGEGYREAWLASNGPVTHLPPGFSSLLALIGLSGLDPLRGARFANSLLFGANAFLLGLIGWKMTKSQVAGVFLALLLIFNASLLRLHAMAMSEPLYIFLSLAAFLAFSRFFQDEEAQWLIVTGCLVGGAYLTRYAGLALLATFTLELVLLRDTWRKRLTGVGIFIASFVPWILGWNIRNQLVAENTTNRMLVYHPVTVENIKTGIFNFSEFLIPVEAWRRALIKIPNLFVVVLSLLALILLAWLLYTGLRKFLRPGAARPEVLSFTNALYIFGYLASVIAAMTLFDASTKFKLRILSPVYVALLVMLIYLFGWLWKHRAPLWRGIVILLALLALGLSTYDTAGVVTNLHKGGQGYASFKWYDSKTMAFLRDLPGGTRIYTNQPGPVYLYTDRPCYVLPDLVDPVTGLPREGYEDGVNALHQDVLSGEAVLVLFKFGAEDEDIQTVYTQLAEGLYLAHETSGDKVYSAYP